MKLPNMSYEASLSPVCENHTLRRTEATNKCLMRQVDPTKFLLSHCVWLLSLSMLIVHKMQQGLFTLSSILQDLSSIFSTPENPYSKYCEKVIL